MRKQSKKVMPIQTYQAYLPHYQEYPLVSTQHWDTIHGHSHVPDSTGAKEGWACTSSCTQFYFLLLIRPLRKLMLPPSTLPHKLVDNLWVKVAHSSLNYKVGYFYLNIATNDYVHSQRIYIYTSVYRGDKLRI